MWRFTCQMKESVKQSNLKPENLYLMKEQEINMLA